MPFQLTEFQSTKDIKQLPPTVSGGLDTSLLLDELRQKYRATGKLLKVDFRQLVHWVPMGDQLTHQVHPYPAKLLPHIAHFFSRASSLFKGHSQRILLDPFCGSGTVALEAALAGHTPYIADANPLALLIARVKTAPFDTASLLSTLRRITSRARRFKNAPFVRIVNENIWYSPDRKRSLEVLLRAVNETTEGLEKDFFSVAFSVTARRLSYADPAISVPVRLVTKDTFSTSHNERIRARLAWLINADSINEFERVAVANIERVEQCDAINANRFAATDVGNDARCLLSPHPLGTARQPLDDCSIPLIVTSPPYGSAQKYIRASSLSLNWLGLADPVRLSDLEAKSIGREHLPIFRRTECKYDFPVAYAKLVDKIAKRNPARADITQQYLHDLKTALVEMARVTAPGGHIVMVVGDNMVCGIPLRNDAYITEVLTDAGLTLEVALLDQIKSRGLMTKRNKTAGVISRESILVFAKSSTRN